MMRIGVAAVCLGMLNVSIANGAAPPTTQQITEMMQRHLGAQRLDALVVGTVIDEQGQPVKNARVLITKGWLKDFGTSAKYEHSSMPTDGPFRIAVKDVDSLALTFAAEGYFDTDMQFSAKDFLPPDWERRIAAGETLQKGVVKREGVKVILQKHGVLANLRLGGGEIRIESDGTAKAWSWERSYPGRRVDVRNWRDESSLPKAGIYLAVEADPSGRPLTGPGKITGSFYPRKVRMVMRDTSEVAGFAPAASLGKRLVQYRSMAEAPEKGYQRELVLEGEPLRKQLETDEDSPGGAAYFYFRTSKGYGKGALRVCATNDPGELSAMLELRFQADGSRLVATKD